MARVQAVAFLLLALAPFLLSQCLAEQCGKQAGFALCGPGLCCSQWGWCGTGDAFCGEGCQSSCGGSPPSPPSGGGLAAIISQDFFNRQFPNRNQFYTYQSFINAAKGYPKAGFGTTGNTDVRKREVAAFLAHIDHETTGLRYVEEINPPLNHYCQPGNVQYPCAPGKQYYGRGPLQLSWNYNYGACGNAIGENLLANPDRVAQDPTVAFKTALWFWSEPQWNKPSCKAVMTGSWIPNSDDNNAGRRPGFGTTINIINGGLECNKRSETANSRVEKYRKFCSALGVDPGQNLDCQSQRPFG